MEENEKKSEVPQSSLEQAQDTEVRADIEELHQEEGFLQRFQENTVSLYPQVPKLSTDGWKEQMLKPVIGRVRAMVSPPFEQQGSVNALLAEGMEELFQTIQGMEAKLNQIQEAITHLDGSRNYLAETAAHHAYELEEIKKKLEPLCQQSQYVAETLGSQNFRLTEAEKKLSELQNQSQYNSETLESQNFRLTEVEKKLSGLQNQGQYNSETLVEQNYQLEQIKKAIENFHYQAGGAGSHYAQSGEDAVVEYIAERLQIPFSEVTYLDLGANHAKYLSNTNYFYEHGARGVLVEANPQLIEELTTQRPEDVVLNRCVATKSGERIPFYILSGDGLSSCDKEAVDETLEKNPQIHIEKTVDVETITVQDILAQYFKKPPILVNVDIEGMELDVLEGFDFEHFRPLIFIVETIPYRTKLVVGEKEQAVLDFMKSKGYEEYAFTGINSILIDTTQLENR